MHSVLLPPTYDLTGKLKLLVIFFILVDVERPEFNIPVAVTVKRKSSQILSRVLCNSISDVRASSDAARSIFGWIFDTCD